MESARGGGGGCSRGSKYDAFLSFRGPDTRHGFVDCLYETMTKAGIRVFIDNESLHVGEVIGDELMSAVDDSKIFMPVFSKSYASSKWCLLELEHIMMMGRFNQEVIPVFYDVSPDDVKLRTRLYSDDLEVLEKKHGTEEVDRWRECLKKVCEIKGWNLEESKGQGKLINRIVQEVLYKTKKRYMNITDHLVGIEGQIEAMMEFLDDQVDRVRFVIIHGMGGIGKTTLAKVIFNDVSSKFEGCSFLWNVRESSQGNGIVKLQQQILNDVLRMSVSIFNEDEGVNEIRQRCSNKRVLLVLDDVDNTKQVKKLAGMFDWFARGSRIIITTRNTNVIPIGLGDDHGDICYYEMREMDDQYATALFQQHAFSDDGNSFNDGELLREIVASTGGLPLALEVVGSHLFHKTEAIWRETLKKLKRAPLQDVQSALMISYESLEDNEKQIFLDIACFFRGIERRIPMYVWDASDLCPESGVITLLHKSLIKIDDGDRICMHDQLRDLGREIVRRDGKSSRIWIHEEAFLMITTKKGTRDVILLDLGGLWRSRKFEKAAFKELVNLRVLRLQGGNLVGDFSNYFPQLMWLDWSSFPSNFQAKNFSPPNLIMLRFSNNDIDKRWKGWKGLLGSKLKFLELSSCTGLTRTPDFSTCLGLEVLVLQNNERLIEIDSSIGKLEQLLHLEIRGSPNLRGLPQSLALLKRMEKLIVTTDVYLEQREKFHLPNEFDNLKSLCHLAIEAVELESLPKGIGQLKLLKYLSFARCKNLTSLPESVWELESLVELNFMDSGLKGFSGNIGSMKELKVLNLYGTKIRTLPEGIEGLVKLEELKLSYCSKLEQIPSEIGNLFSLRVLNLTATGIVELPSSVIRLSRLQHLYMKSCSKLRKVEQLPTSLSHLELPYFSLQVVPDLSNLVHIVQLELRNWVSSEEEDKWTRFRSLASIERLHKLKRLVIEVKFGSDVQSLSQLPHNLSELILKTFRGTTLDMSLFPNLSQLSIEDLSSDEIELQGLEVLGNLQHIDLHHSKSLARLSISSCPKELNSLWIRSCPNLVEVEGISRLESLQTLWIVTCPSLCRLSDLSNLVKLKELSMHCCDSIERMPALPRTENPFKIVVMDCGKLCDFIGPHDLYVDLIEGTERENVISCSDTQSLSQLPHNLSRLTLKKFWATTLDLSLFPSLKNLSELFINGLSSEKIELRGLEVLGNLQKINVRNCQSLARLSISSCPKKLNYLGIMDCPKLVEVEGVSRLESLQSLRLWMCPSLSRLSDLSNLVKMEKLYLHECGSIERMPALPKKTENPPFYLTVRKCGKLRDFDGPHDLYVDLIEGTERWVILRRWIKCI